jgi:hypothetical protein
MQGATMLGVVILIVVMLSVVAPGVKLASYQPDQICLVTVNGRNLVPGNGDDSWTFCGR